MSCPFHELCLVQNGCKRDDVPITNSPVAQQRSRSSACTGQSIFSSLEGDRHGKKHRNVENALETGLVQEASFPQRKSGLSPCSSCSQAPGSSTSRAEEERGRRREHRTARNSCKRAEVIKQSSTMTWHSRLHKTSVIYTPRGGTGLVTGKAISRSMQREAEDRFILQPYCHSPSLLIYCFWQGWPDEKGMCWQWLVSWGA